MRQAKDWIIEQYFNTDKNISLKDKLGQVIFMPVFQMLCPGCVYHCIPQALQIYHQFKDKNLAVLGLHSVFENHEAMKPLALKVFIKEWRIPFPVAVDLRKEGEWKPETMKAYDFQGTPSLVLIDSKGYLRLNRFGHIEDKQLISMIEELLKE